MTWNQRATPAGARLPTSQTLPHPPLATWSALKGHHDPPPRAHMTPKCPQMLPDKAPPGTTLIFRSLRRLRKPSRRPRSTSRSADDDDDDRTRPPRSTDGHERPRTRNQDPGPWYVDGVPGSCHQNRRCARRSAATLAFVVAHLTPMTDVRTTPQPPSTPPNPTHPPTYTHRVIVWTYVVGQTTWLWIITTTTAATEPNAMVRSSPRSPPPPPPLHPLPHNKPYPPLIIHP